MANRIRIKASVKLKEELFTPRYVRPGPPANPRRLRPAERYFGNLDAYRMVSNSAFQAPFLTEKQHWRADPYDTQVGEMETADKGLSYAEFDRFKAIVSFEEL